VIKLIIFDLDGVLVDAKNFHYEAFNMALSLSKENTITKEEHLAKFDGLNTHKKLTKLTKERGLSKDKYDDIWQNKQAATHRVIRDSINPSSHVRIAGILRRLKSDGYKVYCASNSIRSSVKLMLVKAGYMEYIDEYFSNEDVKNPKPHSEIYLTCMAHAGVNPGECLIVEDSHIGREAASKSGAHILGVKGLEDVTLLNIKRSIERKSRPVKVKWQGGKMKVLVPMAGAGSRFEKAGYTFPKPLIEINGKPMIQLVVENLNIDAEHVFIVQQEHYEKYNLHYLLNLISPDCKIVQVDGITEGAACTTLLASKFIDNDSPLLIANSDQFVDWNSGEFIYSMQDNDVDGGILTFESIHPKWSFAKLDDNGFVCEVAEKKPISNKATAGIYYWAKGSDYVKYANKMILKDKRVNNEFYVCPVFNEAIEDKKKIKTFDVEKMWGLGTPEDLEVFLNES